MREGYQPQLAQKLSEEEIFKEKGITEEKLNALLQNRKHFIGNAEVQIDTVAKKADFLLRRYTTDSQYEPKPIL
jgi:hypothetical protein